MSEKRVIRALLDVVAVDEIAPGMHRVTSWGGSYVVDARDGGCECPDMTHNDPPGGMCKHHWAALMADTGMPCPWTPDEQTTDERIMTDGGVSMTFKDELNTLLAENDDYHTVIDWENNNARTAENAGAAADMADTVRDLGSNDVTIVPPGDSPGRIDSDESDATPAEVVDDTPTANAEVIETDTVDAEPPADLPDRSVADDPIEWLERAGGEFVDYVGQNNTPAINRKGFEVLSHFYDVDVFVDLEVAPEENDFQFCRAKARAVTADGREGEAYGSAHVDRGDDAELLIEMAGTRAKKRALSTATGVGAVAVEELRNEVDN